MQLLTEKINIESKWDEREIITKWIITTIRHTLAEESPSWTPNEYNIFLINDAILFNNKSILVNIIKILNKLHEKKLLKTK